MAWDVEGRFKKEGPYIYLWLFCVYIYQKPAQYSKATIFQLKINQLKKKTLLLFSPHLWRRKYTLCWKSWIISETRTLKEMQYEIYSPWHSIPLLSPSTPMFLKVVREINTCYYLSSFFVWFCYFVR